MKIKRYIVISNKEKITDYEGCSLDSIFLKSKKKALKQMRELQEKYDELGWNSNFKIIEVKFQVRAKYGNADDKVRF